MLEAPAFGNDVAGNLGLGFPLGAQPPFLPTSGVTIGGTARERKDTIEHPFGFLCFRVPDAAIRHFPIRSKLGLIHRLDHFLKLVPDPRPATGRQHDDSDFALL